MKYRVKDNGNYFTVEKKYLFFWMTKYYIKGDDTDKHYYMFDKLEEAKKYIKTLQTKSKIVYTV